MVFLEYTKHKIKRPVVPIEEFNTKSLCFVPVYLEQNTPVEEMAFIEQTEEKKLRERNMLGEEMALIEQTGEKKLRGRNGYMNLNNQIQNIRIRKRGCDTCGSHRCMCN